MLSELRKRKITVLFLVLDADENGFVERHDFERISRSLGQLRDYRVDSPQYEVLRQSFLNIFERICALTDADYDFRIELDEWVRYFDEILSDMEHYDDLIRPMVDSIFTLLDHNRDGKITLEEYQMFATVYRIPEEDVPHLFEKFDPEKRGFINKADYNRLIDEFFLSENEDATGNLFFGKFD